MRWSVALLLSPFPARAYLAAPAGCSEFDRTLWTYSMTPTNALKEGQVLGMFDQTNGGNAYFKLSQRNPVLTVDTGQVYNQADHSFVTAPTIWSRSRIGGCDVETSEDGVTWVAQHSFGASNTDNQQMKKVMLPDRSVNVRYIRYSLRNGRYSGGTKWGVREFTIHDCPNGYPAPTTSVTTTTVSTTTVTTTRTTTTTSRTSTTTTTRTTTTTSTTTTSTNTAPFFVGDAPQLLNFSEPYMASFAKEMINDVKGRDQIWARFPETPMVTFKLQKGRDAVVSVAQSKATLLVPSTVLDVLGLDSAQGVISAFEPDFTKDIRGSFIGDQKPIEGLYGVLNINLYNDTGGKIVVNDTGARPIEMTIEANRTGYLDGKMRECAYFDEELLAWSNMGVNTSNNTEGLITCQTNHLSLFAAIIRGFLNALLCSQFTLLTWAGFQALSDEGWASQPTAIVYWFFLATLGIMLLSAMAVDLYSPAWTDDVFLIPLHDQGDEDEKEEEAKAEAEEEAKSLPQKVLGCVCAPFIFCYSSSVCRDALDEVCGRWFNYFGEVRGICESICENLNCCGAGKEEASEGPRVNAAARTLGSVAAGLVSQSARRQACATLAVSAEVLDFLLDDEDLHDILKKGTEDQGGAEGLTSGPSTGSVPTSGPSGGSVGSASNKAKFDQAAKCVDDEIEEAPSTGGGGRRTCKAFARKVRLWRQLHQAAVSEVDAHWHSHSVCVLPVTIIRFFVVTNPLVMMYMNCYFYSRALRVLFFSIEMCSATMIAAVFFDASGMATNKDSDLDCSESDVVGEIIGRLIVVGLVSWIFGSIPGVILESLHSRSFKKLPYQGCDEWKKQLNSWFLQDCVLWLFGICYCGFCILFVCLFLANVLPEELPSWGTSNIIAVVQDELVVPLLIAVVIPPFATFCLVAAARCAGTDSKSLLKEKREKKDGQGNWSRSLSMTPAQDAAPAA